MGLWSYIKKEVFGPIENVAGAWANESDDEPDFWDERDGPKDTELEQARAEAALWRGRYYTLREKIAGYETALETKSRWMRSLEDQLAQAQEKISKLERGNERS